MKISLCLIVFDEFEGCVLDVPNLPLDAFDEVYAVDGGSKDGTVEYLQSQGITVHQQTKKGLNAAYVEANDISTCDAVVAYFPKGTTPPEDLRKFRPLFEQGNELVIASRQVEGAVNEEDIGLWRPRKWAVWGLAYLIAFVWHDEGYVVKDILHGFKGWTRSAFSRMKILNHGCSIDLEMTLRAYKLKIKRAEFPTSEVARGYGETHFKIIPTGKKLLAYLWYEVRRDD